MKRIIIGIYLIVGILSFGQGDRFAAKLLGTADGKIINSINGEKIYPLASVTKMMTILVTYDAISKGEISMDDMVDIPEEMRKIGGSRIWMTVEDSLSVRDLVKATAIYSANNAAYSLAYYVGGGDLDKFVEKMNEKAESLGMVNTNYYTPAGLPPHMTGTEMDVSTVNDIYKLSMELLKNDDYMKIASMKEAGIRNGQQRFKSRNKLLGIDGIYGIKTGHHSLAGYNISIVSKKNDLNMIEIVFGSPDEKTRDTVVLEDLDKFYIDYGYIDLLVQGEKIGTLKVEDGVESEVNFYAENNYTKLMAKNRKIEKQVTMKKDIKAPVAAGTVVGEYRLLIDGKTYLKSELRIDHSIERMGFFQRIFN
ncbi:D-alanyl-D-alanine carboxypeptidase family protein [Psychrilyobacter atlanticus]|uniref:D-alanyl-D-alanine carboxypeptidase family protein n=1 Tax=Psychrilyobacter atlanticus TaxID=271091 RepID=UPI00041912D4|nr:D-alanyl-D-alanine carboxypeptidase family protein [Psychrilyobacter atlanticus]